MCFLYTRSGCDVDWGWGLELDCKKIDNHNCDYNYIFWEVVVLMQAPKKLKSSKVRGVEPLFYFCESVLVMLRKGCATIVRLKLRVFDIGCKR